MNDRSGFHIPVLIAGGGPAGLAMSVALASSGAPCMVLEPQEEEILKPGETLPPNAAGILRQLQLESLVSHPAHNTHTGNIVYWQTAEAQQRYFFTEPNGNGWHLHRSLFEQQLQQLAVDKKVQLLKGWSCTGIVRHEKGWQLRCADKTGKEKNITAGFVADATGRAARLARLMGIKRKSADNLTAYCVWLPEAPAALSNITFIEAVEHGWWYAAPLSGHRTVICFFTDPDLHELPVKTNMAEWFFTRLAATVQLKQYFSRRPEQEVEIIVKPASCSALEQVAGEGWLAVGDAAFTCDPLSAYGITAALGGGIYAAHAAKNYLAGAEDAIPAYQWLQQKAFNNCTAMLQHQYSLVRQWPDAVFWKRRAGSG